MNQTFSNENFDTIKNFVLSRGDRRTYCNMYNTNPHYRFDDFDVYLHPDVGQSNINCDPKLSDFDELVISDHNTKSRYFSFKRGEAPLENEDALARYCKRMLSVVQAAKG